MTSLEKILYILKISLSKSHCKANAYTFFLLVSFSVSLKGNEMKEILEPRLLLDNVTFLVRSPIFSSSDEDKMSIDGVRKNLEDRCKDLALVLDDKIGDIVDKPLGSTNEFMHHYKLMGNIDFQFGKRRGITTIQNKIEMFGPWLPDTAWQNKFICIRKTEDSEFGIRLEYNPQTVTEYTSLFRIIKMIAKLNPFFNFSEDIRVTRHDIACDYPDALQPLMFMTRSQKMGIYLGSGGVQTVYFGTSKSTNQLRIYNKKIEMWEKDKIRYNGKNLWRIELQCREADLIESDSFYSKNRFKNLTYYDYTQIKACDSEDWQLNLIIQSALGYGMGIGLGLQNVLKTSNNPLKIPRSTVKRYRKKIDSMINKDWSIVPPQNLLETYFKEVWTSHVNMIKEGVLS
jgi:hypothetical protein